MKKNLQSDGFCIWVFGVETKVFFLRFFKRFLVVICALGVVPFEVFTKFLWKLYTEKSGNFKIVTEYVALLFCDLIHNEN